MPVVDKIDRRILTILQEDGRLPNIQLAERIGLSATATSERTRFLVQERFIRGFGAKLNPQKLGFGLLVFVEVVLDKTTPDAFKRFAEAARHSPEVLECYMVAGGFDYLIKTRLGDMAAYRRFLGEILLAFPGVRETRTYAVMDEIKNDAPLFLD